MKGRVLIIAGSDPSGGAAPTRDEHIEVLQRIDQETGYDPRAGIWMDGDSEDP